MMQPVRDVLTRNAQCGAILHERDVVVVGHFGASDAEVDPAYDVAQDTLRVVVELFLRMAATAVFALKRGNHSPGTGYRTLADVPAHMYTVTPCLPVSCTTWGVFM